jgi:hypothetical protein
MGAMLSYNVIGKSDQLVVYASRLLNIVEQNYNTKEREALAMVFVLHKFRHYLLRNKFVLCRSYGIGLFGQQTTYFRENS